MNCRKKSSEELKTFKFMVPDFGEGDENVDAVFLTFLVLLSSGVGLGVGSGRDLALAVGSGRDLGS